MTARERRAYGPGLVLRRTLVVVGLLLACHLPAARVDAQSTAASLRKLTLDADGIVQARILAAHATIEAGGTSYPMVHAEVLATLKGAIAPGNVAFANVGPGSADFADGDEVLLFLRQIDRVPSLASTSLSTRLRWAAIPNAGETLVLTDRTRAALLDAVHGYVALDAIQDPDMRGDALRALTLRLLQSGNPVLVTSVLRDLAPGGDAGALTLADLPAMVPLIESSRVPIGTRIALVAELERRGLVFGPARWVRLLRTSQGSDLLAVIRAVGEHPSAGVNAQLMELLRDRDLAIVTAAATSLGVPGNVDAVRPLAATLGRADTTLRHAVIRALERVGTQSARQALEAIAARHPDSELRRRADLAAITIARRNGTTLAPMVASDASAPIPLAR